MELHIKACLLSTIAVASYQEVIIYIGSLIYARIILKSMNLKREVIDHCYKKVRKQDVDHALKPAHWLIYSYK